MSLDQLCQPIRLILSDVDGVLTDGGIVIDNQGVESKQFHVRDGQGIRLWHKAGYKFGLITLRSSQILKIRVAELGIEIIRQGIEHKLDAMREIIGDLQLTPQQVCYIGDDLPDLAAGPQRGLGRGRGRRLRGTPPGGEIRHPTPRRQRRGPRNHRAHPQSPTPLGRFDSNVLKMNAASRVGFAHQ